MALSPEELSSLIGSIYDCAIDPALWPETLASIVEVTASQNGQISINDPLTGRMLLASSTGVPDEWLALQNAYASDFQDMFAPALLSGRLRVDEPFIATEIVAPEILAKNRYFTEWCRPQNLCDSIGLLLIQEPDRLASVGLGRNASRGHFGAHEAEILRLLAPHLRRSVIICNILDVKSVAATQFEAIVNRLNVGVVVVDAEANVLYTNPHAEDLARGDGIKIENGALRTPSQTLTDRLTRTIAIAAQNEAAMGADGIGIPIVTGAGDTVQIAHVLPLGAARSARNWIKGATAAVFVTPNARPEIPLEALMSLFDLTPAEARVVVLLASGMAVADIGDELNVSEATVRTHVARIMSKTGMTRQADVIQLVSSLTPPISAEQGSASDRPR